MEGGKFAMVCVLCCMCDLGRREGGGGSKGERVALNMY